MNEKAEHAKTTSRFSPRLAILLGLLAIVGAAFLYDKFVLMPGAEEKIEKIRDEVASNLSEKNREQVREIAGINPASTFKHGPYEVEQYRFPRGLPFYHRPVLDVAFKGNAIAFVSQQPMTKEYLDSKSGTFIAKERGDKPAGAKPFREEAAR